MRETRGQREGTQGNNEEMGNREVRVERLGRIEQ